MVSVHLLAEVHRFCTPATAGELARATAEPQATPKHFVPNQGRPSGKADLDPTQAQQSR
jgi:hypothetical protein